MNNTTKFVAIDPATGCHLRAATETEAAAYMAQPSRGVHGSALWNAFLTEVRVGDVLVGVDNGPAVVLNQGGWTWL